MEFADGRLCRSGIITPSLQGNASSGDTEAVAEVRNGHSMYFKRSYAKRMLASLDQWACCLLASTLHQMPVPDAVDDIPGGNRVFHPRLHAEYLEPLKHEQ
jgi:hypothetical protein